MTQENYMQLFRGLAQVTERALSDVDQESFTSEDVRMRYLGRIAEAVETLSSLRGDSGIFFGSRPKGLSEIGFQREMYATEDSLRDKLLAAGYVYPQK